MRKLWAVLLAATLSLILAACGGGGGGGGGPTGPTITSQPAAQSVATGGAATFTVAATGTGTLSYQWQVNGTDIAGATSASYTTPATVAGDSGKSYSVKVSDSTGTTSSAAAALTVTRSQPTIENTPVSAQAQVDAAKAAIADIQVADAASQVPLGANIFRLPIGATNSQTIQCSSLGTNGSGSITVTVTTNDATGAPVSGNFSYNACSFGSVEGTFSINGTGSVQYVYFNSQSDFKFTITYNVTYSVVGNGINQSGTVNSTETCTFSGGTQSCSISVNGSDISDTNVSTSGNIVTVSSATVKSGTYTLVFSNVVYDSQLGHMTSGTITITDSATGNRAVITATGSGYTVVVTVNGVSTTYTFSFG